MRTTNEYALPFATTPDDATAQRCFDLTWRIDFTFPGFCLLDLGPSVDSQTLRSHMLTLKGKLSEISVRRGGLPFAMRSLGRFDQQDSTKFHLDGAPDQSLLMLGYEPSAIRSRLFLADYSRCAFDLGIEPQQYLEEFNPMFRKGEEMLARYVTELPQPEPTHSRILLINNSFLSFSESRQNSLGVMHKAEMVNPSKEQRRLVNSMMLAADGCAEVVSVEMQQEFARTDKISNKVYG